MEIRIVHNETGAAVESGDVGMIEVRGPNVFHGYWGKAEQTAREFREDGFFITGDLGCQDVDGYVEIVGRGKDLVISGGLNVYPKEIEQALDELAAVVESAVIGLPHPDLGEAVTAVVEARAGTDGLEQELLSALRLELAGFKLPKRVLFVDALPRNAMGKVQKNLLRQTYSQLYA